MSVTTNQTNGKGNEMKRIALIAAAAASLVTPLMIPVSAAADPGVPSPTTIEKSVTARTPVSAGLTTGAARTTTSVSTVGCVGRTHDPHKSYYFASVHGATSCPMRAPMIVSINLSRDRWWGWQHLANGYKSGTSTKVDGNAKWYCRGTGTYTYRGVSYHRATVGGRNYIGYTANTERFSC